MSTIARAPSPLLLASTRALRGHLLAHRLRDGRLAGADQGVRWNTPSAAVREELPRMAAADRASMAHSLEVRVPFLAHTFVDFASTVPIGMKLRGSTGKYLVRKAIEPWLPPGILDRPKQGFAVPLARWVRGDFGN